ncbi:hypothetical protein DC522_05780 [Microvirga sp. KLBC 81]|nr:hypothetical protein DC522_05780 [Microvirga sp. KLBC 81]
MTPKQKECRDFIRRYISEHGASPSFDEIADGLGLRSKSGVHRLVHALVERGHVTIVENRKRTIILNSQTATMLLPPSLGLSASVDGLALDLPEEVVRALKTRAVRLGVSPVTLIHDAVRAYVGAGA